MYIKEIAKEIGKFFAIVRLTVVPHIHIDEFFSLKLNHIVEHFIVNLCEPNLENLLENIERLEGLPVDLRESDLLGNEVDEVFGISICFEFLDCFESVFGCLLEKHMVVALPRRVYILIEV